MSAGGHQVEKERSNTGLAVAALWLRLRARAIGPAIAAHLGYNAVAVLAALLASHLPQ